MIDTQKLLAETFLEHAEHHPVLDSTQTRARALAEEATAQRVSLPALIVADSQTAGRGRASNRWWTGEGSLAFSVLIDPERFGFPRRAVPRLSLAAGVAIIDALAPRLADQPPGLHWPNDVYVGSGKLAGILVEVLPNGLHIIGVGLNSNNTADEAPPPLRAAVATLRDLTGRTHDHTDLLLAIMENLDAALTQLDEPLGTIGERFDLLCRHRGEVLTVYQGSKTVTGRCVGVDGDGALLLDTDAGRQAILTGTLKPPADW
jgi:BirA family transcriptional regulator, biotin operon repressor / biotin---[acetyl-CoA-carboxylase] ligase